MVEQLRRVAPRPALDLVAREAADLRPHDLLRVGPRAVLMGIVRLQQDVIDPDAVALLEAGDVVDGAEPAVALHHLARRELDASPRPEDPLVATDVVEAVEETRHPTDAALRQAQLQVGEAQRDL